MWWTKAILALFQALKVGHELSYPGAWKNVQTVASLITALLALLWAMGFKVQLLPDDIFAIAGVVVALINAYITIATSKKIGLPSASLPDQNASEAKVPEIKVGSGSVSPVLDSSCSASDGMCESVSSKCQSEGKAGKFSDSRPTDDFPGWGDR